MQTSTVETVEYVWMLRSWNNIATPVMVTGGIPFRTPVMLKDFEPILTEHTFIHDCENKKIEAPPLPREIVDKIIFELILIYLEQREFDMVRELISLDITTLNRFHADYVGGTVEMSEKFHGIPNHDSTLGVHVRIREAFGILGLLDSLYDTLTEYVDVARTNLKSSSVINLWGARESVLPVHFSPNVGGVMHQGPKAVSKKEKNLFILHGSDRVCGQIMMWGKFMERNRKGMIKVDTLIYPCVIIEMDGRVLEDGEESEKADVEWRDWHKEWKTFAKLVYMCFDKTVLVLNTTEGAHVF